MDVRPGAIVALLGAIVFLASSCGQTTSSTSLPTPTAASAPTPAGSPPPGGPVPSQLLGTWLLDTPNPDPGLTEAGIINGKIRLTLTATSYLAEPVNNYPGAPSPYAGAVVVNNTEIDFFSETSGQPPCHLQLPLGVGRYTWTLRGSVLHFTPLKQSGYFGDPCGRLVLADQSYIRTR
ncbi:MAG TPA: hypothetical protein VNU19_14175 [Candidatus Acidoferrum sp.]|jgi:hypothetical protein|nr:hypothetical protein [Candidatus Acidoferrum sp.]